MKRFLLLVSIAGSAIAGFLWWKRQEVARARDISRDPWPSVTSETRTTIPQSGETDSTEDESLVP